MYNSRPEEGPVDFKIKVTDFAPRDVFNADLRQRLDIISKAFYSIDVINESYEYRDKMDLMGNRNFTYGEARFHSFYPLLSMVKPKTGEVFFDLGCGTGLPSAIAAIMFPQLARSEGVEYFEIITSLGQ